MKMISHLLLLWSLSFDFAHSRNTRVRRDVPINSNNVYDSIKVLLNDLGEADVIYNNQKTDINGEPIIQGASADSIHLERIDLRSDDFVLQEYNDGVITEVDPGEPKTLRGHLINTNEPVAGSLNEEETEIEVLAISKENQNDIYIQSLGDGTSVQYTKDDVEEHKGTCGALTPEDDIGRRDVNNAQIYQRTKNQVIDLVEKTLRKGEPDYNGNEAFFQKEDPLTRKRQKRTVYKQYVIHFEADYDFYTMFGRSSVAVSNKIQEIFNLVLVQYNRDLSFHFSIQQILVRTSKYYYATESIALLRQFRSAWFINGRNYLPSAVDVAHLVTGKDLQGTTLGVGYIGVVCDREWFWSLSMANFNRVAMSGADLMAHELGHNFNAQHCGCRNTMNTNILTTNQFSTITINAIKSYANRNSCYQNVDVKCTSDSNCDDGVYCNGKEICLNNGECYSPRQSLCPGNVAALSATLTDPL